MGQKFSPRVDSNFLLNHSEQQRIAMLLRYIIFTSLALFVGLSLANTMERVERPVTSAEPLRTADPDAGTPFMTPMIVADDGTLAAEASPDAATPVDDAVAAVLADLGASAEAALPVQYVTATRVNLRAGPGTENAVVGQVNFAEAVSVVALLDNGWAEIRIEGDGGEGFIAARFLTPTPPQ